MICHTLDRQHVQENKKEPFGCAEGVVTHTANDVENKILCGAIVDSGATCMTQRSEPVGSAPRGSGGQTEYDKV